MLHQEKPPLDELTIEHFGIKGMQWGVRKHYSGGQIRTARRSANQTRMAVDDARLAVRAGVAPESTLAKAKLDHLNNPDRVTASRITKGEVAVAAILISPIGAAALVVGSQTKSRVAESRQVRDYYTRLDQHSTRRRVNRAAARGGDNATR
jgi:hypothetical protein